ncbi:oligosaccharide flippase family protein [Novosphingobium sp. FGD1]|uniref:Oligosaccharide flippase family protein n=1 Tax=Novosphingobium silvae TaxID=2692619 RepID=A0A7X4GD41_9SPHN|nr:oligosaccharide flippase family protein [Novosphingobium silvae]MYL96435.1 oligosaccharide flippase family protein [Novosphingobium silvae]
MIGRLLINSSAMLGGQLASVAITLIQSVILARAFGPEQFGKWALLISASSLIANFLAFRTSESLTCFWVEAREQNDANSAQVYLSSALIVEFATKLMAGFATFIMGVALLGGIRATWDIVVAAALIGLYRFLSFGDAAWMSLMRDEKRIKALSLLPTAQAMMQLCLIAVLLAVFGKGLFLAALSYVAAQTVFLVVKVDQTRSTAKRAGVALLPLGNLRSLKPRWRAGFWKMMGAGYLSSCLSSLMKEGDTLVVGLVASDSSVGFYRLARSLVSVVQLVTQAIATLILQDFAEIRRNGAAAVLSVVRRVAVPFAALVLAGCAVIAIALPAVIKMIYGPQYAGAVLPFRILLVGTAVSTSLFWVTPALIALREVRAMLHISFMNFAAYVASMALGIYLLQGTGPAVATSVAWTVGYSASLVWLLVVLRREKCRDHDEGTLPR